MYSSVYPVIHQLCISLYLIFFISSFILTWLGCAGNGRYNGAFGNGKYIFHPQKRYERKRRCEKTASTQKQYDTPEEERSSGGSDDVSFHVERLREG